MLICDVVANGPGFDHHYKILHFGAVFGYWVISVLRLDDVLYTFK
jgi:hypothetical protein